MFALLAVLAFVAAAALDYVAAHYYRSLGADRFHAAGLWSVGMCLLSTIGLLSVVDVSRWYIIPECLGLYAGTRFAGWRRRLGT